MASAAPKPTLHEIAAMPYPASEQAMREHYDPSWGKPRKEGEIAKFRVEVEYTYRGTDTWECEVEAVDAEEAEELAMAKFDKADLYCDGAWNAEYDDFVGAKVTPA